jgi:CMP-N-acetylneuraminic acid synthetase
MKILGIIPARGGSKRVPGKNLKMLKGKPLIQISIESAKASTLLDQIIVSTDDEIIANVARGTGLEVPFLRPSNISTDQAADSLYIKHAIDWFKKERNESYDAVVLLRPTSPFRTPALIDEVISKFKSKDCTSLRTVSLIKSKGHPYWCFKQENNYLKSFVPGIDVKDFHQSQLLPDCYAINGLVDIVKSENLLQNDLYGNKIAFSVTSPNESVDIDTEEDYKWCRFLMGDY